jgi:hypothetical protein
MSEIRTPYLKLVPPAQNELEQSCDRSFQERGFQSVLFPTMDSSLLYFINIRRLNADDFVRLLQEAKPAWLIDTRLVPRFDLPKFNRQRAFDIFNNYSIKYYDLAGLAQLRSAQESTSKLNALADCIQSIIKSNETSSVDGPLAFLFDDEEVLSSAIDLFPNVLRTNKKLTWQIMVS